MTPTNSKKLDHLKTSDYIALILKTSLDHTSEVLQIATIYAGNTQYMKKHQQERLIKNLRDIGKNYNKNIEMLVKKAEEKLAPGHERNT